MVINLVQFNFLNIHIAIMIQYDCYFFIFFAFIKNLIKNQPNLGGAFVCKQVRVVRGVQPRLRVQLGVEYDGDDGDDDDDDGDGDDGDGEDGEDGDGGDGDDVDDDEDCDDGDDHDDGFPT